MAGRFTVAAAIRQAGVVLSQPVSEHHAIERIAAQDFHQAEIGQIAVERGGGTAAAFLHRMHGEFEGDAAGIANAVFDALRQRQVDAIARRQIAARSARCR